MKTTISAALWGGVLLMLATGAVPAATLSPAEYAALQAKYAAQLPARLGANQVHYDRNVNPLANGGLEALDSPYDQADAFFCKNNFVCPGWMGAGGAGGGGQQGSGTGGAGGF